MNNDHLLTIHPTTEANWLNENVRTEGMVLRDYFAAKAMQSLYCRAGGSPVIDADSCDYFAHHAYQMADAMLKARNKVEEEV